MRKSILYLLSLLVVVALALTACGTSTEPASQAPAAEESTSTETTVEEAEEPASDSASEGKTVLNVWSFTNEMMTMATAYEGKNPNVDIEYTMIPMTNGEYQTKLLASLGTADAPDVIALEASFVKDYVESDFLANVGELLPEAEAAGTYPFVIEVGTYNGVTKAFSYQATPGAFFYRRSLAEKYFGTDDPEAIQELLSDFDKFTEAAAVIKEQSGGDTYMVASNGDFQNLFFANRAQPWVVDDALTVDPMVEEYVRIAKLFREEGYEAQATQWQEGWFAGMNDTLVDAAGNPKQVFGYFLPTWGLPYVLAPNAVAADGSSDTTGDWAVIEGPLPYQWGGTWIGALEESDNLELAKDFVRFATLDEENLTNWATGVYTNEYLKEIDPSIPSDQAQAAGDFVSSQVVVNDIIPEFDNAETSAFLGGQNSYAGFASAAPSVSAELMQGSDDAIQRALNDPLNQYLLGEISEEEMWAAWKDAVRVEFPELIIN
ncbi:MAG: carbohydrate ABC transporter substrate-binding protein [Anaerolineales bacterium]|nr:carbohydrate ABC transporter substrate-binding protein [Anaerolineales bacterium]